MSTPTPDITALVDALNQVMIEKLHADRVISTVLKQHPHWRSTQRAEWVETCYQLIRWHRLLAYLAESENSWAIWAAWEIKQGNTLPEWDILNQIDAERIATKLSQTIPPAIEASVTDELFARGEKELGSAWPKTLLALNQKAPRFIRVNRLKTNPKDLQETLNAHGFDCKETTFDQAPDGLLINSEHGLFSSEAFRQGLFEVQDIGSQQIAPFLDLTPGMKVADACAGNGGKSLHIASLLNNKGRLLALDLYPQKLDNLRKRATRAGCDCIETRAIKNNKTIKRLAGQFDRVLLDVPCSGSGVWRRNPDAKWRLDNQTIQQLIEQQQHILQLNARLCKPEGKLIYATCSVFSSENQQQIDLFLKNNPEWQQEDTLSVSPSEHGADGFYAARLKRT